MHRGPQNTLMCNKREKNKQKTNKSFGRKSRARVHCLKGDHFQASKSNSQFSYSLDLFSNYNGVLLTDLCGSFSFIVVWTVVLIGVTVNSAKQISTATVKTWNSRKGKEKVLEDEAGGGDDTRTHHCLSQFFDFTLFLYFSSLNLDFSIQNTNLKVNLFCSFPSPCFYSWTQLQLFYMACSSKIILIS